VAHAQSTDSTKPAPHRDRIESFYMTAYTGTTTAQSSDVRIMQPSIGTDATYHSVDWLAHSFTGSPYWGVKVGYYLPKTPRVSLELEYNHAKVYAKVGESKLLTGVWEGQPVDDVEPMIDRVGEYRITNGINTFAFNGVYRIPISVSEHYPEGRWQPYVGGGPEYFLLYSINNINGKSNKHEYHPSGWGWQVFTGVRYLLTPRFGLYAETKYQDGDAHSILPDDGRGDTDLHLTHYDGGVYYQF